MFKPLSALNRVVGAVVSLVLAALLGLACWWGVSTYLSARRDQEQIAALTRQIVRLETALRLLKVDHRVAQIDVLSQQGSEKDKTLVTTFSFVELDDQSNRLTEPRTLTVKGDLVYVDYWVVKFSDESVEAGDPLRGTSICLFRRIFGEHQNPVDGYVLDAMGSRPVGYGSGREPTEFETEIWVQFWELANNRALAEKKGIRAIHGEAPSQKLAMGKRYKVLLRASGGLSFQTEDAPPRSAGPS